MKKLIKLIGEKQEQLEEERERKVQNAMKMAYIQGKLDLLAELPAMLKEAGIIGIVCDAKERNKNGTWTPLQHGDSRGVQDLQSHAERKD